jgi:hypothetical protein
LTAKSEVVVWLKLAEIALTVTVEEPCGVKVEEVLPQPARNVKAAVKTTVSTRVARRGAVLLER